MAADHTHYPDYANPELLDKIPLSARVVLDVGCAQGALGEAYLRRNPRARMLGIDADPASAAHAATRLTEVICCDVEDQPMPFAVPEGIDCIIYGDVLEHMVDPWALLAAHAPYLNPDATVLVCMPNVEHWSFAFSLLSGRFDYQDQGLFDRTHLRWFTPRMMRQALSDAGLAPTDLVSRPIDKADAERFTTIMAPALKALGIDPADYLNRAGPLQFIWRARKTIPARLLVEASMLEPQGGVSDVRVIEPMRGLQSDSAMLATIREESAMAPAIADTPRIAVLHRAMLLGDNGVARIKALLAKGYVIVTEFDDDPDFMIARGVPMDQLLTFKGVHAVQTSTAPLAELLRAHNPETALFANAIFQLPPVHNFNDPERLTMIFAAFNRGEDWAPLMPAINDVARLVGERLHFEVLHDQAFFDALETPHKAFTPLCDYAAYIEKLGHADLAFMPLADNKFNRAKSDLKFIEASSCRVASLASRVVYQDSIVDNTTGLLFGNAQELRTVLLRLLAYPEASRRMADNARAYVAAQRMLAYQVQPRIDWYRSLWDRREALTAALAARVPALFD